MTGKTFRKSLAIILALMMLLGLIPMATASATEYTSSYYTYTLSGGQATITDVDSSISGAVTIPSSLDGYTVVAIESGTFAGCTSLTSVTIPNSVTTIGEYAFEYCRSLTSVTIPNSVTTIGEYAFEYCESLTSVTIPNSVTTIGEYAFWYCTSLTSVTIPNSVTTIGEYAFGCCTSLTSVTIPNSVTTIGEGAFWDCTSLTSVTIPNSVTTIGEYAFGYCTSLKNIKVDIDNAEFCDIDGVLYNKDKTVLIEYPAGKTDNTYIVLAGVTEIGHSAFYYCTGLTSVTIPNSVTTIGEYAFWYCRSLTSVTIPNSVTTIGGSAFGCCTSLTSVTIPNSVTTIGEYAFGGCTSLTSVTIPNSVTTIGEYAFRGCTSLKNIKVDIDNAEFCDIDGVLYNKDKTVLIEYPAGKTDNTYIVLAGVTEIGRSAFWDCTSLTSVTIPNSVTTIGESAFRYCTSLTSVTIPNSVTTIGECAFANCESLTSVTIPNSVTTIGTLAFVACTSLTSVTIPNSVTTIGEDAFGYCYSEDLVIYGVSGSYAEDYAQRYSISFVALSELVDAESGIVVVTDTDAQLRVEQITEESKIDEVNVILDSGEVAALYDITLMQDGAEIQPDNTVTVKIPTDNENSKVCRVEADGTLTDMDAIYRDGYMEFTAEHFSLYVLLNTSESMLGDVNLDGVVNIKDATAIQKHIANLISLTDEGYAAADVDGSGAVNVKDATAIQKHIAGIDTGFDIG